VNRIGKVGLPGTEFINLQMATDKITNSPRGLLRNDLLQFKSLELEVIARHLKMTYVSLNLHSDYPVIKPAHVCNTRATFETDDGSTPRLAMADCFPSSINTTKLIQSFRLVQPETNCPDRDEVISIWMIIGRSRHACTFGWQSQRTAGIRRLTGYCDRIIVGS
jgi:hypothetical protein